MISKNGIIKKEVKIMDQPPQIPPAVIQFAKEQGYKNIKPNSFWNGKSDYNKYKNYIVYDINDDGVYFCFILFNDNEVRMANEEEIIEITDVYF